MTVAPQRCPFCNGTGIVDDEGWSHPGRGYRADYPRTLGDGLIRCGGCDGDGFVPADPADEYRQHMEVADAERLALRAVIAKAIDDLDAEHRRLDDDPFDRCWGCSGRWPCPSARVADDLRTASEETT